MREGSVTHLGLARVAHDNGVERQLLRHWVERHDPEMGTECPCPQPLVIDAGNKNMIKAWPVERMDELYKWVDRMKNQKYSNRKK